MRRIKNSVKAIIVSCVAVACVLAIVLGCVFGLKRDKKPNEPPTPPQVDYSELVRDINSANEPVSYELYDSAPYASVEGCTTETLTRMGKNYFCYTDVEGNEIFYYYTKSADGYVLVNLTNKISDFSHPGFLPDNTQDYSIFISNKDDSYLQINCLLDDFQQLFRLIYLGENGPVDVLDLTLNSQTLLTSYSITSSSMILVLGEKDANEDVYYENLYLCKLPKTKVASLNDIALYKEEKISEFTSNADYGQNKNFKQMSVVDGTIFICFDNTYKIVSSSGEKAFVFERNLTDSEKSAEVTLSHISDKGLLLKFSNSQVEGDNFFYTQDNKKVNEENFYYKLDGSAFKEIQLNTPEGYSNLMASQISDGAKYFYVSLQRVENHNLKDEFLNRYYDADGNIVLEYKTTSSSPILYADDINFLTKEGLFKFKAQEGELFYKFSDHDYTLKETNKYSDIFILKQTNTTFLMNLSGDIIFNNIEVDDLSPYIDLVPLSGHFFLGSANISGETFFYLIDANTQTNINQISNFYSDEKFEKIINLGTGLYLVNEGETYSLYENNVCKQSNIKTITYTQNLHGGANVELQIQTNEKTTIKNLVINSIYEISFNDLSESLSLFSSNVKPYYESSQGGVSINSTNHGDIWVFGGGTQHHDHTVTVDKPYYFVKKLTFTETWGSVNHKGTIQLTSSVKVNDDNSYDKTSSTTGSYGDYESLKFSISKSYYCKYTFTRKVAGHYGGMDGWSNVNVELSPFVFLIRYYQNYNPSDKVYTTVEIEHDSTVSSFTILTRDGFTHAGWAKVRSSTTPITSVKCEGAHVSLYAIWKANAYKVEFNLNGGKTKAGSSNPEPLTATYDTTFTVDRPTKNGYKFTGWEITGMLSAKKYHGESSNPNTEIASGETTYTDKVAADKDSYNYKNLNYGCDPNTSPIPSASTVTFTAQWTKLAYTIEFYFLDTDGVGYTYDENNHTLTTVTKSDLVIGNGDLAIKRKDGTDLNLIRMNNENNKAAYYSVENAFSYSDGTIQTILNSGNFKNEDKKELYEFLHDEGGRYPDISIQNSPYQIAGWVYKYIGSKCNVTKVEGHYHLITGDTRDTLIDAIDLDNANTTLRLYAVYNPRSYFVDFAFDAFGSSTNLLDDSRSNDINKNLLEGDNQKLKVTLDKNNTNILSETPFSKKDISSGSVSNGYDVLHSNTAVFTFKTLQPGYVIDFIELRYFPYKTGNTTYSTTTITIDLNWNTTMRPDVTYGNSKTALKSYQTNVLGVGNTTCYYINDQSKGTNDIAISYQRGNDQNIFVVTLMIVKLGFAKNEGKNGKFDGEINDNTVTATGTYGFVVAPKVSSFYMYPDTVVAADANKSEFKSFNPGVFYAENDTIGYSQYFTVPVSNGEFWIGGTHYEGMNGKKSGFYKLNPTMGNIATTVSSLTDETYVYYDQGNNLIYYRASEKANYGNTEIIAISPKQAKVRSSKNSGSDFDAQKEYYELLNYLTGVNIRGTRFNIGIPTRKIDQNVYGTLQFSVDSPSGTVTSIASSGGTIDYFGTTYTKAYGYTLSNSDKTITFKLYVAYDNVNNHVMYFLFSETESLGATDDGQRQEGIILSFADFNFSIDVSTRLANESDKYYSGQNTTGVDVSYDNKRGSSEREVNYVNTYQNYLGRIGNVAPQNTYRLAFKPQNGYLIYSITVSIGETTLYSFTLNQKSLGANITGTDGAFSLYEAGTDSINVLIDYTSSVNNNLQAYISNASLFNGTNWGIYFSNQFATSDAQLWGRCGADFESFYLLVSGIYDNIKVDIETISYFEFDFIDSQNLLGLDAVYDKNFDGCRLSILTKNSDGRFIDVDIKTLFDQEDIILLPTEIGTNTHFYRMIFFGAASTFGEGFAFFSSDLNYSNYFNNLRFYHSTNSLKDSDVFSAAVTDLVTNIGPISQNIVFKGNTTDIIYFETGSGLHNFFTKYRTLSDYVYREDYKNFVSDFKFQAMFTVNSNITQITTNSYLSNENLDTSGMSSEQIASGIVNNVIGQTSSSMAITTHSYNNNRIIEKTAGSNKYLYQLDNPATKVNSWFNDTFLTNINYSYNQPDIDNPSGNSNKFSTNWQNIDYTNNVLKNVSGYQIELVYYVVPGYYLQYIDLYTIKTGWFYIQLGSVIDANVHTLKKAGTNSNVTENCSLSYKIKYESAESCYYIYLYDNSAENTLNKLNSVGILADNLIVNFYSKAHTININYNANVDSETISTKSELRYNGALSNGIFSSSAVYDSTYKLEYNLTMTGYTFIGWGSQNISDNKNRFDNSLNVNKWDSSSGWTCATNLFESNNEAARGELMRIASTPTENEMYNGDFDFYVAGGYFVSDTGFENGRGQIQNYNFWSAYANKFCANLSDSRRDSSFSYNGDLSINLYGIWKANTYNVVLNLNDAGVNDAGAKNGSTSANFARLVGADYNFDTRNYNGIVNPGDLHYNTTSTNNTQSVFVTFDTNDWYVVERNADNEKVYSTDNFSAEKSKSKKQSLKDYVIDRYGYTWLGWFSAKLLNYREGENTKEVDGSVTPIWTTTSYSSVGIEFPQLNFDNYNKLKNGTGIGDVSILKDNITDYFFVENEKSVYSGGYISKFVYKNQLGRFDDSNNAYIYFYTYAESRDGGGAGDTLNGFAAMDYNNYFTYFDTAIDYMSYKEDTDSPSIWFQNAGQVKYNSNTDESKKINNFRSITLFAYWQTNLYTVIVDYRDSSSKIDAKTGIGSTAVNLGSDYEGKTFAPVFFDDELESRLNKFIPVRLGYDFLGWSFNPEIRDGTSALSDYVFSRAASYRLDSSNTDFLFISAAGTRDLLTKNDIEKLGDRDNFTHVVYLFAGWTAQEFSINVSLNIEGEELKNLYRSDSEFAIALYRNSFNDYTGLKQSFAMTKNKDEIKFVDIVANISFKVTFDTMISEAVLKVNNVEYSLDDLFATAAGYYLLGWLYNPGNTESYLVQNSLNSSFDTSGNLSNKLNLNGFVDGESVIVDIMFNEDFYNELYSSFFVDGNNNAKKLSDVDFESVMEIKLSSDRNHFDTFNYSTNKSTNFGTIDGKHYLAVEYLNGNYYMFYYNDSGIKQYVTPYIYWNNENRYEVANIGSGSNLTFDGTNFYYNGYVVYYENYINTYNAFYTIGDYGYDSNNPETSSLKRILIHITTRDSLSDDRVSDKENLDYRPLKTRQITLYAHWNMKEDLSLSVTNGNNGNGLSVDTTESNHGLAGYYDVWTSESGEATTSGADHVGNYENGIEIEDIKFYDNLNYLIYPFHNGRYLSEMRLTFYSYEDVGPETGLVSSYQKATYLLILKFRWDNINHTLKIVTDNNRSRLERNGTIIQGLNFAISNDGTLTITGSSKLTNLDLSGFEEKGFMKILGYNAEIPDYTRNSDYENRIDLNAIEISMKNIKSEISMTCTFSVQTYIAEFYNVFDPKGINIKPIGGTSDKFTVDGINNFTDIANLVDSARYANGNSSLGFGLGSGDVINLSNTSYIPTIQTDCSIPDGTYNVPYGTFIYGNNQEKIPNGEDLQLGREEFGGYEFLYQGSYYFGTTTDRMNNAPSQCSPILGEPSSYVQSARKASTLYSFRSWYEATEGSDTIIFDEYSETDEETFISRNIILFGYYYANNKPTNIQFYTWDNVSSSYAEYTNNVEEYTLQSTTTNSSFVKDDSTMIVPNEFGDKFVNNDQDNLAIIMYSTSYGIDGVQFTQDAYSSSFIRNDNGVNRNFVNDTLIRNYWYYKFQNYYLYFIRNGKNTYIRYNSDQKRFYYLEDEDDPTSIKHPVNLYTPDLKDNTFIVYADLNPDTSGVKIGNDNELNKYITTTSLLTQLSSDNTHYTYDFKGSEMYASYNRDGEEKYYKIKSTKNYQSDTSLKEEEKAEISQLIPNSSGEAKVSAKYYVKLGGKVYYLICSNGAGGTTITNASDLYTYIRGTSQNASGSFSRADELYSSASVRITYIDNYFFVVGDRYYQVEYPVTEDENGGYINPWNTVNTCTVNMALNGIDNTLTFYFDYNDKDFYVNYNQDTHSYSNRVTAEKYPGYKKYTPVNDNYTVEIDFNNSSNLWEYKSVKIRSLPDPTIGLWYGYGEQSKQYYGYIGYINVLESDLDYLIDPTLNEIDEFGRPTDPNKQENKDRIYDTLVKYIDRTFEGQGVDLESLHNQARNYVNSYKSMKSYLSNLITVSPNGFVYDADTNIVRAVDVLLTCSLKLQFNGVEHTYYPTVKYRFDLITTNTSISENIYAIPIYCRNAIEFSTGAITNTNSSVTVDTSKMTIQVFENIANNFTHMYTKQNGDYLRFIVLTQEQYDQVLGYADHPSGLANVINKNHLEPIKEEDTEGSSINIPLEIHDGDYYILAYYNKSGLNYPFRISDNIIHIIKTDGDIRTELVSRNQ